MDKLTVTLPQGDVEAIRALVAAGKVGSVSAFVRNAVFVRLDDVAGLGDMQARAQPLVEAGGPPNDGAGEGPTGPDGSSG